MLRPKRAARTFAAGFAAGAFGQPLSRAARAAGSGRQRVDSQWLGACPPGRAGRGRKPAGRRSGRPRGIRGKQAFASAPRRGQGTGEGFARQRFGGWRPPAGRKPAYRRGALRPGGDDSNVPHRRGFCRRRAADSRRPTLRADQVPRIRRQPVHVTAQADTLAGDRVRAICAPQPARRPIAGVPADTDGIRRRARNRPAEAKTPARAGPGPGFVTGDAGCLRPWLKAPAGCGRSRRWNARR